MEKKTFNFEVEFKEAEEQKGQFQAVFSRFDEIDKHGDITKPGAFKDGQEVRISAWGHNWGSLPVGKGTIYQDAEKAWVDGEFFLDTTGGADTYKTVKNLGSLQEWSYGFDVLKSSNGKSGDQEVRFLEAMNVFEVSPVLIGAGNHTTTTIIKDAIHTEQLPAETQTADIENPETEIEEEAGNSNSSGVSAEDVKFLLDILEIEVKNGRH